MERGRESRESKSRDGNGARTVEAVEGGEGCSFGQGLLFSTREVGAFDKRGIMEATRSDGPLAKGREVGEGGVRGGDRMKMVETLQGERG